MRLGAHQDGAGLNALLPAAAAPERRRNDSKADGSHIRPPARCAVCGRPLPGLCLGAAGCRSAIFGRVSLGTRPCYVPCCRLRIRTVAAVGHPCAVGLRLCRGGSTGSDCASFCGRPRRCSGPIRGGWRGLLSAVGDPVDAPLESPRRGAMALFRPRRAALLTSRPHALRWNHICLRGLTGSQTNSV